MSAPLTSEIKKNENHYSGNGFFSDGLGNFGDQPFSFPEQSATAFVRLGTNPNLRNCNKALLDFLRTQVKNSLIFRPKITYCDNSMSD